jgi:outer membrane protein assembly factor BamB/ABC-type transport system substrate-binding protein
VAEGRVFLGAGGYLNAFDENTGGYLWGFRASGQLGYPAVAVAGDGKVFFGTAESGPAGRVYALDAATGSEIWSFPTEGYVELPVIDENRLYFAVALTSGTGKVYCLDASTGSRIWDRPIQDYGASVALAYGEVYVGCGHWETSATGCVYCLNVSNGQPIWSFQTYRDITGSISVANGKVYFSASEEGSNCVFFALNATNGKQVWNVTRYPTGEAGKNAVAYGKVFFGIGYDSRGVYALDEANGNEIWAFPITYSGAGDHSNPAGGPVVADDKVFFAVGYPNHTFYAVSESDGSVVWNYQLGGSVHSQSSAVANGRVFVADHYDPKLCAFGEPYSGTQYSLTITATTGGATVPPPKTYSYSGGAIASIRAMPDVGYGFDHWELDSVNVGSQNPLVITMNQNHVLHAVFSYGITIKAHCYTEDKDIEVSITMDNLPTGYTTPHAFTGLTGTHNFTVPDADLQGHPFKQWNTGETDLTIVVSSDGSAYTAFYQAKHHLTITTTIGGTTEPTTGDHSYWEGTEVTITAEPSFRYLLDHWELDGLNIGGLNPIGVTMYTDHALRAVFIQIGYQPRIDDAFMQVIQDPDAATSAFQACEVEFLPDMIRWANIRKLINENQIVLAMGGYHYCYLGINCRSYVPDDAGQPDAGRALAPLNWTDFRQALLWAGLSHAEKEAAILTIYGGPVVTAVDSPVPPTYGVWHWEPPYYPGCNYTKAWEYLEASGFTIAGGKLVQPNGVIARDTIEVLSPAGTPTSIAFTQAFVDKWNDFFDNFLAVTNCNFINNPVDFGTVLVTRAFTYRNFDIYFLCWSLGRFTDYLYDFFHSSQDYPDSKNAPGLKDPALDHDLELVKWGTVYEEKLAACYDAQRLLVFEDCPTIELYSRTYFTAFKNYTYYGAGNKYLANAVNQKGVGADNRWTWGLMHWSDSPTGGTVKYVLGSNLVHLHPGWATSESEWDVLNRIEDGLMTTDLEMADLPNIACKWTVVPFDWPDLNIYSGTKVTFQIRSDVLWHDLHPVDIYDVKFALDFLRNFPRYGPIYQYLMWSQIVDPCTIDIYLNTTSQWILYDLADTALLFPEHMYGETFTVYHSAIGEYVTYHYPDGWLKQHGYDPVNAAVDTINYNVGEARKALIGCGPYVFDYWDPATNIAHVVKFHHFWINAPIKANTIQPQKWDPCTPFTYYVEIVNEGAEDQLGNIVPFVIDYIELTADGVVIYVIPGPITVNPFSYAVLGPYEWHFDKCNHYMGIHIYAYGDPVPYDNDVCPIVVSLKQDVTNDCYVGIDDIFIAASAFGSSPPPFPGYERWDERCDVNGDYYIGIDDIFDIAVCFGWDA